MTEPLALILYEKLLPGSQLVNRLQDLHYRVQTVADADQLVEVAEQAKPLVVLADLDSTHQDICAALGRLRQHAATAHLPIIGFTTDPGGGLQTAATAAGVTLTVSDAAILHQLTECLDQALQLD
jgi:CheY-like chemotaxis protein